MTDLLLVAPNNLFGFTQLMLRHPDSDCNFDLGREPELGLAIRVCNVDVHPRLLS
jgi:hypothetical protein